MYNNFGNRGRFEVRLHSVWIAYNKMEKFKLTQTVTIKPMTKRKTERMIAVTIFWKDFS